MINSRISETTKYAPYELWMGYIPRAHQPDRPSSFPQVESQKERLEEVRKQAQEAMGRAQLLWQKEKHWMEYQVDQKVWLETKHLKTTHPTTKL